MKGSLRRAAVAVLERRAQRRAPDAAVLMSALAAAGGGAGRREPVHLRQPRRRAVPRRLDGAARPAHLADLLPPDNPVFMLIAQVRRGEVTVADHDMSFESPRLRKTGIAVQGTPLPEEPGAVLLVMQDASAARTLDRQLAFPQRRAQRHRHGGDPGA